MTVNRPTLLKFEIQSYGVRLHLKLECVPPVSPFLLACDLEGAERRGGLTCILVDLHLCEYSKLKDGFAEFVSISYFAAVHKVDRVNVQLVIVRSVQHFSICPCHTIKLCRPLH